MTIPEAFARALHHHQSGRLAEAGALYRQILAHEPRHADALQFLGIIASQSGRHDVAVELLRQAVALVPGNAACHSNYGEACRKLGRLHDAVAAYREAIRLQPALAAGHNNLGNALADQGAFDEAVSACREAIRLQPDFAEAWSTLGGALRGKGASEEAVAACRQAIQLRPDCPEAHGNLGNALRDRGEFGDAIASHRRMIALKPQDAVAHCNLGGALSGQGDPDGAIAEYRHAIALDAGCAAAWCNLGNALKDGAQPDAAMDCYRRAIECKPDDAGSHSNLVYLAHFHPRFGIRALREERARWAHRHAPARDGVIEPHGNLPDPARRLRVGYVSPDFQDHVIGRNMMPLFANHDRGSFEIFCYSGTVRGDALTDRFRTLADHWRTTVGVNDADLAAMIRGDGVDILVDLTQHMTGNRLTMFARRPAPVQVSFAGYPDSTGMEAIGHRISDRHLEVKSADGDETAGEQVSRIDSFWCYDPCGMKIEVNKLPASASGAVTFGCLNNFCKITDEALALWARVLAGVEGSRLMMLSPAGSHRARVLDALRRSGVDARRIEWATPRPRRDYLALYHRLDVVLDTFPYNGHTTSLDAIWMGVPVITFAGDTPVSRAGLSILNNLGASGWVAQSQDEYVRIAIGLAKDLTALARWRAILRERMETSVLMDAPRFARQIEHAYREIWRARCASQ